MQIVLCKYIAIPLEYVILAIYSHIKAFNVVNIPKRSAHKMGGSDTREALTGGSSETNSTRNLAKLSAEMAALVDAIRKLIRQSSSTWCTTRY